jgi:hypothetical protein
MNKLNSIDFYEIFDVLKARKIWSNWDKLHVVFETVGEKSSDEQKKKLFNLIINYNDPVRYNYSKNKKDYGRLYCFKGLQSLKREIRNTICFGLLKDYDMENAQCRQLYEYTKSNHIIAETLKEYCTNRKSYYHLKQIIIEITNGKNLRVFGDCGEQDNLFLSKIDSEISIIQNHMIQNVELKDIVKKFKKEPKDEIKFKVCQEYLEIRESKILEDVLEPLNLKHETLMFDGFMTPNSLSITHEFATFIEKPMIPFEIPDDWLDTFEEFITDGENQSSKMFLRLIGNDIKKCDGIFYMKKNGIWNNKEAEIKCMILERGIQSGFRELIKTMCGNVIRNYSSNLSSCKKMIETTLAIVPDSPDFLNELYDSNLGKICWNDGWYEFKTGKFHKGFDDIMTTIKINRKFPERNEEHIKELNERFLDAIYGDLKDSALCFLSQSLSGICKKNWSVVMGERNSGKTKIAQLSHTAFGKYVNEVNADNFLFEKAGNGNDKAKKLSWLTELEFSRITFSSEIKIDQNNNQKIDGVLLKSLASGGDKIQIRQNYINERSIRLQSTIFLNVNDIGSVSPTDAYETMTPFNLPNKFVKEDELDSRYNFMKLRDSSIDDFVKRTEMGDALFWVLADYWNENHILNENQKIFKSEFLRDDEFNKVHDSFTITTDKTNIVENKQMQNWITNNHINMTTLKLKEYLKKRGAKEYRNAKLKGLNYLILQIELND